MTRARTRTTGSSTPTRRRAKSAHPPAVDSSDIARRAYDLFLARGREHGHDLDDWLQAERELKNAVLHGAA